MRLRIYIKCVSKTKWNEMIWNVRIRRWKTWAQRIVKLILRWLNQWTTAKTNEKNAQIKQMNRWREKKRSESKPNATNTTTKNMHENYMFTYVKHSRAEQSKANGYWAQEKVRMLSQSICCKLHFFIRIFDVRFLLLSFRFVLWLFFDFMSARVCAYFFRIVFAILSIFVYDRYEFLYKFCACMFCPFCLCL